MLPKIQSQSHNTGGPTDRSTATNLLGHGLTGRAAAAQKVGQVVRKVVLPLRLPELLLEEEERQQE